LSVRKSHLRIYTAFPNLTGKDNLLVFYIPDEAMINRLVERLQLMGYPPVPPENPYWAEKGITIEDPDGWRIVLMNTRGI
jgi:uncharacterized glyoxalase superfamily protein PhnB